MNKKDRKKTLLVVEGFLRRGINTDSKTDIVDAYRFLEDLLVGDDIYMLSDMPEFPVNVRERTITEEDME